MRFRKGQLIRTINGHEGIFDRIANDYMVYAYWDGKDYTSWINLDKVTTKGLGGLSAFLEKTT